MTWSSTPQSAAGPCGGSASSSGLITPGTTTGRCGASLGGWRTPPRAGIRCTGCWPGNTPRLSTCSRHGARSTARIASWPTAGRGSAWCTSASPRCAGYWARRAWSWRARPASRPRARPGRTGWSGSRTGELDAELDRVRAEYNTIRLHASIGYVTPDDEHEGRGDAIRQSRRDGLAQARENRIAYRRTATPEVNQ